MSSALDKVVHSLRYAPTVLEEIRARTERKMIGFFHPVVPSELIYAAGLHPVAIYPHFDEPITAADSHLQSYVCSYLRASWDQVVKGKYLHINSNLTGTAL